MTVRTRMPDELAEILRAPAAMRRPLLQQLLGIDPQLAEAAAYAFLDRHAQAEHAIEECQANLVRMVEELEKITTPPLSIGAVAAAEEGRCVVALGGSRQQVQVHPRLNGQTFEVGDVVCLSREGNVIVDRLAGYRPPGRVGQVLGWHQGKVLVEYLPDQPLALDPSPSVSAADPKPGDRVYYQEEWRIALEPAEKPESPTPDPVERVLWEQVGGLDDQIEELLLDIETRVLHPERAAALRLPPLGGFILAGPPGTGKTLLVKALATWIEEQWGRRVLFRCIAPGSWRDPFYGMTERRLVEPIREGRRLLADGEADLVILFYDEIDTLGTRSGEVTNRIDSRVLTSFLTELDGSAGRHGILVCGATNRLDMVDEALLRPGRFGDLVLEVPRPGRQAARAIFRCHLTPDVQFLSNGHAAPAVELVERSIDAALGRLFADGDPGRALVELVLASGQRRPLWPREVLSGAVIANIVSRAKRLALRRGLVGPGGLVPDDLAAAVDEEMDTLARRLQDPHKVREVLAEHDLPVVRVEPRRLVPRNGKR